jgi:hypothetical protein
MSKTTVKDRILKLISDENSYYQNEEEIIKKIRENNAYTLLL